MDRQPSILMEHMKRRDGASSIKSKRKVSTEEAVLEQAKAAAQAALDEVNAKLALIQVKNHG